MKNLVFSLCVFCALCLPLAPVISLLHLTSGVMTVSYLPLLSLIVYKLLLTNFRTIRLSCNKWGIAIVAVSLLTIIIKSLYGQDALRSVFQTFIVTTLLPITFTDIHPSQQRTLRGILLLLFVATCVISYIERSIGIIFFPAEILGDQDDLVLRFAQDGDWSFRSCSLYQHPLKSAQIICIMLSFMLAGSYTLITKAVLTIMGAYSLLCFNARGAIIVFAAVFIPYLYFQIKASVPSRRKRKLVSYLFIAVIVYLLYYVLTGDLGGRLVHTGLNDESSATRLETFEFFRYLDLDRLLIGDMQALQWFWHIKHFPIENGEIAYIVTYGLIAGLLLLTFLFLFVWNKTKSYMGFDRAIILIALWVIGSMNPNLAGYDIWIVFWFSFLAFTKRNSSLYEK